MNARLPTETELLEEIAYLDYVSNLPDYRTAPTYRAQLSDCQNLLDEIRHGHREKWQEYVARWPLAV